MNQEFSDVQAGFRKGRGTRDEFADICGIMEEAKNKSIYFCFTDYAKTFDCVDHNKLWKILRRVLDHLTCLLRNLYVGQGAKLEADMEEQTGSKLGKEYSKAVCRHLAYLTYIQRTLCRMAGWMNYKLE